MTEKYRHINKETHSNIIKNTNKSVTIAQSREGVGLVISGVKPRQMIVKIKGQLRESLVCFVYRT